MKILRKIANWFYRIKKEDSGRIRMRILFFVIKYWPYKVVRNLLDKKQEFDHLQSLISQMKERLNRVFGNKEMGAINENVEHIGSLPWVRQFISPLYDSFTNDFVAERNEPYIREENDVKLIAYYLPQFHAIPLNDRNFGRNFTEWTNVTKATPHFIGHHQPQLPIDVGFYDLSTDKIMYRQIELAKKYGIYAFSFYYYWFGKNKRLLEKPIFNWLENKELDFPFCLCWANENWSTLWDGGNREVIMEQRLTDTSATDFIEDIIVFLKDPRYIKINGAPLLTIYRPTLFTKDQFIAFADELQEEAKKHGFPRLHLLVTNACQQPGVPLNCTEWHVDGIAEFPPHGLFREDLIDHETHFIQQNKLTPLNIAKYVSEKMYLNEPLPEGGKRYKGVFPSWDNTARKAQSNGVVFTHSSPEVYGSWLSGCIEYTQKNLLKEEQFVFINAWNEWAEGTHLEPDRRYGYAYLQKTLDVIMQHRINEYEKAPAKKDC